MKPMNFVVAAGVLCLGLAIGAGAYLLKPASGNADAVMQLAAKGASETDMMAAVDAKSTFVMSASDVIKLKTSGVPNSVIVAMLHKRRAESMKAADAAPGGDKSSPAPQN